MNYYKEIEGLPISLISERTSLKINSSAVLPNQTIEARKTGTTTVGIVAKDCVVLAADQRGTMGNIADKDMKKIYHITNNVATTIAGAVGDSLAIIRFLRSQANLYEIERDSKMSANAVASLLSNILNANRYYPFMFQPIIGGFVNKPELFELTPFGCMLEKKNYAITGSGTHFAMATFDKDYKENLNENEAIELVVKAVSAAKNRDIYSGGDSVTVVVIDKNGYREIDRSEVDKIIKKIKFN
jgi:proteasome beta subunit